MAKKQVVAILIPKLTDTKSFTKLVEKLESKNSSVLFFQFDNLRKDKKPRRWDIKAFIHSWDHLKCILVPMQGYWESIFPGLTTYYELSRLRRLPIVYYKYFINEDDVFTFQDSPAHINNLINEEAATNHGKTKQSKSLNFQIWKGTASVSPEGLKWAKSSLGLIESLVNNTSVPAYKKNDRPVILILVPDKAALMESFLPLVVKLSSKYSIFFFEFTSTKQKKKLEQESKDFVTDMNHLSCVLMPCNNLPGYWEGPLQSLERFHAAVMLKNLPTVYFQYEITHDPDSKSILTFMDSPDKIADAIHKVVSGTASCC